MKKVICLYGGPGTGKSTTAAALFALLKQGGVNTELVREYVKDWVWEGRDILSGDQYYIFTKQSRKEKILFKDVDVIVTDAPVWLSAIYEKKFEPAPHICPALIDKHVQLGKKMGFEFIHIFLTRRKVYNPKGRFQTEEQAKQIDEEILGYLISEKIPFIQIAADDQAASLIVDLIKESWIQISNDC